MKRTVRLEAPCAVGDPCWIVFWEDGVVSVERQKVQELLWDGETWKIGTGDGCYDEPDKECVWLSIEGAVNEAERQLKIYGG